MSMFDGIVQNLEMQAASAVAAKMGIPPSMAQIAINALTQNQPIPGDTVTQAAQQTGLPQGQIADIFNHLGGDAGLGALINAMGGGAAAVPGAAAAQDAQAAPAAQGGMPDLGALGGILGGLLGGQK